MLKKSLLLLVGMQSLHCMEYFKQYLFTAPIHQLSNILHKEHFNNEDIEIVKNVLSAVSMGAVKAAIFFENAAQMQDPEKERTRIISLLLHTGEIPAHLIEALCSNYTSGSLAPDMTLFKAMIERQSSKLLGFYIMQIGLAAAFSMINDFKLGTFSNQEVAALKKLAFKHEDPTDYEMFCMIVASDQVSLSLLEELSTLFGRKTLPINPKLLADIIRRRSIPLLRFYFRTADYDQKPINKGPFAEDELIKQVMQDDILMLQIYAEHGLRLTGGYKGRKSVIEAAIEAGAMKAFQFCLKREIPLKPEYLELAEKNNHTEIANILRVSLKEPGYL